MRKFEDVNGRAWRARLDEGSAPGGAAWEIVLFEDDGVRSQRIVYRPAGWLQKAPVQELIDALAEAESVRTRWG